MPPIELLGLTEFEETTLSLQDALSKGTEIEFCTDGHGCHNQGTFAFLDRHRK